MYVSGDILKQVREDILLLSQAEAADKLGITRSTLQRWERDESRPQPYHHRRLYEVYGQSLRSIGIKIPGEEVSDVLETHQQITTEPETPSPSEPSPSTMVVVSAISTEKEPEETFVIPSSPFSFIIVDAVEERDEVRDFIDSHMTTHLWNLAYTNHLTCSAKQQAIQQAIKDFDTMNATNKNYQITRREALSTLATLPAITLRMKPGTEVIAQPSHYGMILEQCSASIEACWQLSRSNSANDLTLAFQCVSKYLPMLESIVKDSPQYRTEALDLAAQYALVKPILGLHCVGRSESVQYAKKATILSKETGNISLLLSSQHKLAWRYFYNKQYPLALKTAQEAENLLQEYITHSRNEPLHSSVRGGTYSVLALMLAKNGKSPNEALKRAISVDPENEIYAFMDFKPSNLLLETGMIYCYSGDQPKAMEVLERRIDVITFAPKIPQSESGRLETINTMALSSVKERDMEKAVHCFIAGIEGAKTLHSEQRFNEAAEIYELMQIVWPDEARITELHDLTEHW